MPPAKGLFHKAIVQSGVERALRRARAHGSARRRRAEALRPQAEPGSSSCSPCRSPSCQEAVAPAQKTLPRPRYPLLDRYNFGPVIDGKVLPAHPFDPAAPAISDDVPVHGRRHQGRVGDLPRARQRGVEPQPQRGRSAQALEAGRRRRRRRAAGLLACRDPTPTPADRLITALTASNFGVRSDVAGRAQGGARQGAGLDVRVRLGDAGLRRQAQGLPFGRGAVRVRYAAT